ncbi:MAG: hypothetical protein LGR52_02110, partial [Candidatus Thiosymbion ectosymbiont of Robbea hypermnestra]|nr:hypothetical protein [Candidatus Thiosymbion ectosymbiont of Robbea hypermnestra]
WVLNVRRTVTLCPKLTPSPLSIPVAIKSLTNGISAALGTVSSALNSRMFAVLGQLLPTVKKSC